VGRGENSLFVYAGPGIRPAAITTSRPEVYRKAVYKSKIFLGTRGVRALFNDFKTLSCTILTPGIIAVIQTFGQRINFHLLCDSSHNGCNEPQTADASSHDYGVTTSLGLKF
jgi:hypothetical protein